MTLPPTAPSAEHVGRGCCGSESFIWNRVLEGWWDLSLNVRYQLQKPGQAWLRAGCGHLSPPTLSESPYTYLLRPRALECAPSQSPAHPGMGENWEEDQPGRGENSWKSLDLPRPSVALRSLGILLGAPSGPPRSFPSLLEPRHGATLP